MDHGIDSYFRERVLAARRVATLAASMSVLALAALLALELSPPVRDRLLSPRYFGIEGAEEYQRRIQFESERGGGSALTSVGTVVPIMARRGGHRDAHSTLPNARPVPRTFTVGPGEAPMDVLRRGRVGHPELPEVRSEDLVFEHKVAAEYPPMLFERDIEGWALLEVVVDTLGEVSEMSVLRSSGEPQFEHSASVAARQCRFRPYHRDGKASAIVTRLRFTFNISRVSD